MDLIKKLIQEMIFAAIFLIAVLVGWRAEVKAADSEWNWTDDGIVYQICEDDSGEKYIIIWGYSDNPSKEFIVPPEMDGVPVTAIMPDAFYVTGGENLTRIVLPESIESLPEIIFRSCNSLEDVTLGGVKKFKDTSGIETEKIPTFFSNTKLKRLTLGDACNFPIKDIDDWNLNIMSRAILNNLEYIYIGNQMPEVTEQLFYGSSLREIEVGAKNAYYKSIQGMILDKSGELLISVPTDYRQDTLFIPYGTKRIAKSGGFGGCKNIKTIYIPQTVETFSSFKDSANKERTLYVVQGSAGEEYAKNQECMYQYYGVYLNKTELTLKPGESETLQTVNETENNLRWSSSAPDIVQVDHNGKITAQKNGQTVVSVTDGEEFTVKCRVTVSEDLVKPDQKEPDSGLDKPDPETPGSHTTDIGKTENKNDYKVGQTIVDPKSFHIYKVTGTAVSKRTVAYMGSTKKNIKSITIPKTIRLDGNIYKVTEIAPEACKGLKKLSAVTISENVTKIGKRAFYGCKKLKKITVKSRKLKTIGQNALKGIHKNCRIKVPSAKLSAYKKLFRKKGQKSSVKFR